MFWNNLLQNKLGIKYPVIQAPMLGITTPRMVGKISNAGGLGSLAVGGLSPDETTSLINEVKKNTSLPFAVNLFAHDIPEISEPEFRKMQDFLDDYSIGKGIKPEKINASEIKFFSYKEQIDILIDLKVPIVSFTFGIPDDNSIEKLKAAGIFVIGTATCIEEAIALDNKAVDALVAQGIEAGGHRGTFINHDKIPQIGTFVLTPMIADSVKIPVIAAGGITDGRSIIAAGILGAQGFQVGSLFLRSNESKASAAYKEAVKNSRETSSVLSKAFSGKWARLINNDMIKTIENSKLKIPVYPIQNSLTQSIRKEANFQGQNDLISLFAGQRAGAAPEQDSDVIFNNLIIAAEKCLAALNQT
jgi:nitronate monooxygenase